MEKLPQELVNAIVDHLVFDRASLVACSLLSHSWRAPAIRLVFASLYINGARDQQKFKAFADFMEDSPELAAYVEELELHGKSRTQLELNILVDILAALPRLRVLRLETIKIWDRKVPIAQTFPLETLNLEWVTARSTPKGRCTIMDLLHLFPRLRHLKLDVFLDSFMYRMWRDTTIRSWRGVSELTVYVSLSNDMVTWLCAAAMKCTTLRLFVADLEKVGALLQWHGANLENLEVELQSTLWFSQPSGGSYARWQH